MLANHKRLQIFKRLLHEPGQNVTEIARQLRLPLAVASQYLRALESRGLLKAQRRGRRVRYQVANAVAGTAVAPLLRALRRTFERDAKTIPAVFHLLTAFTHPRRIELYQTLTGRAQTVKQLQVKRRMSARAVTRHLKKLEGRSLIVFRLGTYAVKRPRGEIRRALASMALRRT
ncbi:MAG TPA: helix-turn-helix domain-containing protein [Candidatus Dormibacteraeota bacterium]|nr:helix-turn-helix domain-containing protein [Verrucomicrobiae bacterium]HXJ75201.1 helix-turn-helix domain-containing protein [Candidatus Dormibacteraeota bacterium]